MAQRPQILARHVDAVADGIGIFRIECEEIQHRTFVGDGIAHRERLYFAENRE
jgi:hypothetical protein